MRTLKNLLFTCFTLLFSSLLIAQDASGVEMADGMMASGKIYVVVAVLTLIFLGIIIYLILLDRKISKLEREIDNES